jgi:adenine-specific DNA-methyltransferase
MDNLENSRTLHKTVVPPRDKDGITHQLYCMDNVEFLDLVTDEKNNTIDFCYLDPPYNTGGSFKSGFTYHDSFKNKGDKSKHVGWLAFMRPRLEGLVPLLKETGVVAISIDDSEVHHLRMLCDEVFGESNFVAQVVVDNGAMKNNAKLISTTHEYLLIYAKNLSVLLKTGMLWRTERTGMKVLRAKERKLRKAHKNDFVTMSAELKLWMKTAPLSKRLKVFYNIDENGLFTSADLSAPNSTKFYDYPHPVTKKPVKTPSRGWGMTYEKLEAMEKANEVLFFDDETKQPMKKLYLQDGKDQVIRSILNFPSRTSTHLLEKMLGRRSGFSNPKNLSFITHLVDTICPEDGVVLDYFAGSGTTGHAVIDLNTSKNATRTAILCTNNENNIYDEVTEPRLKAAITGKWGNGTQHEASLDGLSKTILNPDYKASKA